MKYLPTHQVHHIQVVIDKNGLKLLSEAEIFYIELRIIITFYLLFKRLSTSLIGDLNRFTQLTGISHIYEVSLNLLYSSVVFMTSGKKVIWRIHTALCQSLYGTLNTSYYSRTPKYVSYVAYIRKILKREKKPSIIYLILNSFPCSFD